MHFLNFKFAINKAVIYSTFEATKATQEPSADLPAGG